MHFCLAAGFACIEERCVVGDAAFVMVAELVIGFVVEIAFAFCDQEFAVLLGELGVLISLSLTSLSLKTKAFASAQVASRQFAFCLGVVVVEFVVVDVVCELELVVAIEICVANVGVVVMAIVVWLSEIVVSGLVVMVEAAIALLLLLARIVVGGVVGIVFV